MGTMRALMELRYPVYAMADVVVESHERGRNEDVVEAVPSRRSWRPISA